MKFLHQTRQFNCGQTCLAMLLEITIGRAEQLMMTVGSTSTKEMRSALQQYGGCKLGPTTKVPIRFPDAWVVCEELLLLFVRNCPGVKAANHWALWDGYHALVLDPAMEQALSARTYHMILDASEARVTSFIKIR